MQSFNITEGLEAAEYTWRKLEPRKVTGVATGESETLAFTGSTLAMKDLAAAYLAEGSAAMQVSCTVTRAEANMARLEVTRTWYTSENEQGPGQEQDPENPPEQPAATAGSSENNPIITFDYAEIQQPILTHPLVVEAGYEAGSDEMVALRMLAQGADMCQTFVQMRSSNPADNEVLTVAEALSGVPAKIKNLVATQQFYLDVAITCSCKFEIDGANSAPDMGQIPRIEDPPRAPTLCGNRNWLFVGGGVSLEGDRVMVTKNYKASDAGGWNPDAYK